ncbi:MAG: cytochrome c-type biogenesis CcmF C-terminal domain-containing protein, partial [Rhodospirillales bacterium]
GWGGFWFWDPVENASFMPWLLGTALLHSASVVEKRDTLKSWTLLLAILTFSLSLLGTFLVRSGALTSVHTFANDPGRGLFILALLVIAIGGSLALYAWRAPHLKNGSSFAPISRESGLLLNNLLLTTACATVLLGTLYPLFLDLIDGSRVSVGAPFYNATFLPLMLPLFVALPVGALLTWKRASLAQAVKRLWLAAAIGLGVAIMGGLLVDRRNTMAIVGLALAAWLVVGAKLEIAERIGLFRLPLGQSLRRLIHLPRSALGMTIAHASLGILIAGVTAVSAWQEERILVMKPGDQVEIAGYQVSLDEVNGFRGPNYDLLRGHMTVRRGGALFTILEPERRFYRVQRQQTTEAAIHTNLLGDIYGVLGEDDGKGGYTVRLYYNPLAPWIWVGAILCALGGGLSLTDRRHRVGAPARAVNKATVPA